MFNCNKCKRKLDRRNRFTADKTKVFCPDCRLWQFVEYGSEALQIKVLGEGENARITRHLNDMRPSALGLLDILDEQGCSEFEWQLDEEVTVILRRGDAAENT